MVEQERDELLATYGRYYGEQHFAVAFTVSTEGDDAKKVGTRGWDKTAPLADGPYGASYVAGRGKTKNPAIVLRPSNLIVLECDSEDDLLRIEAMGLPATVTVRSSKQYKRHYYFRPSPELEALPYVAFRFESGKLTADSGRYFLAPPALHPSGSVYSFLPGRGPSEIPIATIGVDVYQGLAGSAHVEDDEQRQAIALDPTARFSEGSRRTALFRYACMLRRWGLDYNEILKQTLRYNDLKCAPPVQPHLVEVQVDGAMKKRGGQELAEPVTAAGFVDVEEEQRSSWEPLNLNTLPAQPPVKPTLGRIADIGLVYPGMRHVFSGPPESAKTLAAYLICIQVIRDGGFVILFDFEMGAYNARGRLQDLGATTTDLDSLHYLEPDTPATEKLLERLRASSSPDLVVIDASAGAYDLQGLDDNKRQDVGRIYRLYVEPFFRAGIATIFLDHVVKNSETRGKFAIGSERKVGVSDVHLGFEVITPISRGHTGLYKIVTHKDRGGFHKRGILAELELRSDPDTHQIGYTLKPAQETDEEHPWMPTKVMQKVSALLEKQSEPIGRNQITAEIGGRKDYTLKAVDHLVRLGYVTETDGPNRTKLALHTRPFTVYEWEHAPDPQVVPGGSQVVPGTTPSGGSHPAPPYGERNHPDHGRNDQVVPDEQTTWDWVDELTPQEHEPAPADLHDPPTTDTTPGL